MPETHQEMIDELMEMDEGLTGWEIDFLEAIDGKDELSERQLDKLKEIHERLIG